MIKRTLGRTGLQISEIGFGASGLGGNQWRGHREEDALAALRYALEHEVNFIDTALSYNEGHSERLIARILKETGVTACVATKIPPRNRVWPAQAGIAIGEVFPHGYIVECTETSLRNLGTEQIDLQQFHVWNPEWIGSDEWKRAIEDLKKAGKVKFFGISINDHQPDSAIEVCRTGLIDTVQVIFNVFDQSPESNLFPLCEALGIGVIARVPLDEGALTGAITPDVEFHPEEFRAFYFRGERKREVVERVNALRAGLVAAGVTESLALTALRFTLTPKAVSTVIPGMRKLTNVKANLTASERGPVSDQVLEVLRKFAWDKNYYC